jgi:hypothetical protein
MLYIYEKTKHNDEVMVVSFLLSILLSCRGWGRRWEVQADRLGCMFYM